LIDPFVEELAARVRGVSALGAAEQAVVLAAGEAALRHGAQAKLSRLLLLELHAAVLTGEIDETDARRQWERFIELACTAAFDEPLGGRYPRLHERMAVVCKHQIEAVLTLATRIAADRGALAELPGRPGGELAAVH